MKKMINIIILFYMPFIYFSCNFPPENKNKPEGLKLIWELSFIPEGFGPDTRPVPIGDSLVVWNGDKYFNVFYSQNGKPYFRQEMPNGNNFQTKDIFVENGNVYFFNMAQLWCWNINSKVMQWMIELPEQRVSIWARHNDVTSEKIYACGSNEVEIISIAGVLERIEKINHSPGSSIYDYGKVYCGFFDFYNNIEIGWITCYEAVTFDSLWAFHTDRGGFSASAMRPVVENGILYIGANYGPGLLAALNAETGAVIWKNEDISANNGFIVDNIIYGNDTFGVWAVDKNSGEKLWFTDLAHIAHSPDGFPAYLDGYIYQKQGQGIFILDAGSGEILEHFYPPAGEDGYWHVSAGPDRIYAQSSNMLYCYESYGK